jgi:hypothetical protein
LLGVDVVVLLEEGTVDRLGVELGTGCVLDGGTVLLDGELLEGFVKLGELDAVLEAGTVDRFGILL